MQAMAKEMPSRQPKKQQTIKNKNLLCCEDFLEDSGEYY
jgi:hypothetical protein